MKPPVCKKREITVKDNTLVLGCGSEMCRVGHTSYRGMDVLACPQCDGLEMVRLALKNKAAA